MFSEDFVKLSSNDQRQFASVCNKLLLKGFIVRDVFDSKEKVMKINPDFRFLERYDDIVKRYLEFSGWTLQKDLILGVFALYNDYEENRIRADREVSLILFTLRLIYEDQKQSSQGSKETGQAIYLTTPGLIRMMMEHGILMPGKKLTGRLIGKSLRFLANHNIITKVSGSYDEGNVSFYILPSIVYALDNDKIVAMSNALDELNGKNENSLNNDGGVDNENIN